MGGGGGGFGLRVPDMPRSMLLDNLEILCTESIESPSPPAQRLMLGAGP